MYSRPSVRQALTRRNLNGILEKPTPERSDPTTFPCEQWINAIGGVVKKIFLIKRNIFRKMYSLSASETP
jgi:hypothetical protein